MEPGSETWAARTPLHHRLLCPSKANLLTVMGEEETLKPELKTEEREDEETIIGEYRASERELEKGRRKVKAAAARAEDGEYLIARRILILSLEFPLSTSFSFYGCELWQ